MAEIERHQGRGGGGEGEPHHHQVSGKTVAFASLAGLAIGGPLLGLMGLSFLAAVTLLLISSPLFIIFSPLFFCAALFLAAALAGFAGSAAMAIAGLSAFGWVFRSFRGGLGGVGLGFGVMDKLMEEGEMVKEEGKDWAGYLEQKVQNPEENRANRG